MSHCDVFHLHSVTKMHHLPCCFLCTPTLQPACVPISASCVLLPFNFTTTPSLHHASPPSRLSFGFSKEPCSCASLHFHLSQTVIHIIPCLFHPTPPPFCFSLPVCSGRFCGSRSGCVNVKPFLVMIIFITRCVSRCPRINTN